MLTSTNQKYFKQREKRKKQEAERERIKKIMAVPINPNKCHYQIDTEKAKDYIRRTGEEGYEKGKRD